jgi:hypothetical protein
MASAVSPTSKPDSRRRRTIVVVGLAVLVLVVVVSAGVLINRVLTPASTTQSQRFPGTPMRDALGVFSATTPPDWNVTGGAQPPSEYCAEIGGINPCIEQYVFQDQQPGDTMDMVTIEVLVTIIPPIPTVVYCPTANPSATPLSFLGLPASIDGLPVTPAPFEKLVLQTPNATFEIRISVLTRPSRGFCPTGCQPAPTVTDAAAVEAQAQAIINSIQVTDHASCK